ncbi:helix-turn-helix domain-containing protein [Paenarthrobacter aurescens]|uniref:helix-turn-helix domain-containing protein n=1 Tax=Paenarthrobacter aurescens TaxID=43663 RepID=UPI0035F0A531
MNEEELARCLRGWRDRLRPESLGLPIGSLRRAPGLRREEVANAAGISVDYLARLEQGRAGTPSHSVLQSLARALRLSDDEKSHLFRLAGHANPSPRAVGRQLTPGVHRILNRFTDTPVMVLDAAWQVLAINFLASSLLGDWTWETQRQQNLLWRHFTGAPIRVVATPEEDAEFEAAAVADLRTTVARYAADEDLRHLISDLRRVSPRFEELWQQGDVARHVSTRKTIQHPLAGQLTLECDVLAVNGNDLKIVIYTAEPGSPDADALSLLDSTDSEGFASFAEFSSQVMPLS